MTAVLNKVLDTAKQLKRIAGYHVVPPDAMQVLERIGQGYRFLAYSTDFLFLGDSCRTGLETVRRTLRKEYA
jgi:2-dehydro-3-deoxyglucarate aldolase